MTRTTLIAGTLVTLLATPAFAQVVTGGAGNTGVQAPSTRGVSRGGASTGGMGAGPGAVAPPLGNAASGANSSVPGTTPGVNIGGTPTAGPPGTGGTAGGIGGVNK